MQYYQLQDLIGSRLITVDGSNAYDLVAAKPTLETFRDLARAASIAERPLDDIVIRHFDSSTELPVGEVDTSLIVPVDIDKVWAAGITYQISEEAREEESHMSEIYLNVYDADRPEIFKATRNRTVGSDEAVGIRADST